MSEDAMPQSATVVPISSYQSNRLVATCDELKFNAEHGDLRGLLYIMDSDTGPTVGVSGSFRSDPAAALAEAHKLVAVLTMMMDAKIVAKNLR
jgi:hypothetical protein